LAWALDQAADVFPAEEDEAALLGLLRQRGGPPRGRAALARLAGRGRHLDRDDRLTPVLDEPHPVVQTEALRALNGPPGTVLAPETVRRLLASPDPAVRAEAVTAALARDEDPAWLEPFADDPDVYVRAHLADGLVRRGTPQDDPL